MDRYDKYRETKPTDGYRNIKPTDGYRNIKPTDKCRETKPMDRYRDMKATDRCDKCWDMKTMDRYRELFNGIHASGTLKTEVCKMTAQAQNNNHKKHRKISVAAMTAAVLALVLMGTSMAAALPSGTLSGWFSQQWAAITGQQPDEAQLFTTERLTQPVGVSDTCKGITVTLDSVTVGDSTLWLFLKLDGDIPPKEEPEFFHFKHVEVKFHQNPDTRTTPGGYACGMEYAGITDDGKLSMLMDYSVTLTAEDSLFSGYRAELCLDNLMYHDKTAVEGKWRLPFTLNPVEDEVLTLDSAVIPAWTAGFPRNGAGERENVEIQNIRVSATGIRYTVPGNYADSPDLPEPDLTGVVLSDGSVIPVSGGGGRWTGEWTGETYTGDFAHDMIWRVPVDLSKVTGLQFRDTVIPLR